MSEHSYRLSHRIAGLIPVLVLTDSIAAGLAAGVAYTLLAAGYALFLLICGHNPVSRPKRLLFLFGASIALSLFLSLFRIIDGYAFESGSIAVTMVIFAQSFIHPVTMRERGMSAEQALKELGSAFTQGFIIFVFAVLRASLAPAFVSGAAKGSLSPSGILPILGSPAGALLALGILWGLGQWIVSMLEKRHD